MTDYYIYAKDFSGSTEECEHYHSNGLKTLEQFKSDVEKIKKELLKAGEPPNESRIIYLHWGHYCREVDEDTTRTAYLQREGNDRNTKPDTIVDWLETNNICGEKCKIRLLYIITDGMINYESIELCFELNKDKHYETVVFHAFNEDPSEIDLSVAASFFKSRCIVYCNNNLHDCTDISEDFDYDKITVDNFVSEKDNLKSYIKLKFLKSNKQDARALREIDKLKKLRARLFNQLMSLKKHEKCDLETKNRRMFLREFTRTDWYKTLVAADSVHMMQVDIEKSIATLINYIVSEAKSFSFDALKFDTTFNATIENECIEEETNLDVNFAVEQEIAFPDIILDDDKGIPVILLTTLDLLDKLIFHGKRCSSEVLPASFSKFKSAMDCPLFLMSDKDISESIGYFYTLNVYKQFLDNNTKNEPRTRKPFHGGLVLTDTDQFDRYNDYILSATYFDSKKVNFNVGLFYYVLWKNCENKQWMDRNVVERFKKYAMRRIGGTVCKIGLSSLPLDPPENTSLPTALWYCVEMSSCIFKDDPQNFNHERMRMFYGVSHCMIEILKYFDYDLDLKSIETRRELVSNVMILKKIQKRTDKVYYLLAKIFKTVDGFLVSEIEKPFNLPKLNYLKLHHKNMLRDDVVNETVHLNDYIHLMHCVGDLETSKNREGTYEICEKTFRPFFTVDRSKSFYTELLKDTRRVVISDDHDKDKVRVSFEPIDSLEFDRILSPYNLFIKCVKDLEKYPTLPEYVEYISKKKFFYGDLVTIFPPNVHIAIKNVYERYQNIVSNVEVKEFIKVCKSYVTRTDRIKAEDRVKFDNDDEIKEFVAREELKVNLNKQTRKIPKIK